MQLRHDDAFEDDTDLVVVTRLLDLLATPCLCLRMQHLYDSAFRSREDADLLVLARLLDLLATHCLSVWSWELRSSWLNFSRRIRAREPLSSIESARCWSKSAHARSVLTWSCNQVKLFVER